MVTNVLFDKYINLTLMESSTPGPNDLVVNTPATGRKPNITIKGSLIPAYSVAMPEIRIVNFYSDRDLEEFKYIKVEAGYSGSLFLAFEGELFLPFIEKPSPDSITVFPMVLGNYTAYRNAILVKEWPENSSLRAILTDITSSLGMTLVYDTTDYIIAEKIVSEGRAKDVVAKLCTLLPNLRIQFDSKRLLVYNSTVGRSDRYIMDKITMASKKGSALTVSAPWIPTMRPGDIAVIDPIFYKQSIGSTLLPFATDEFIVNVIDFVFSTVNDNNMIALMLNRSAPQGLVP